MSSPTNPNLHQDPLAPEPVETAVQAPLAEEIAPLPPLPPPAENPPWSGWDVLALACVTLFTIFAFMLAAILLARRFVYPAVSFADLAKYPGLIVLSQALAYLVIFAYMYVLANRVPGQSFLANIRWNFPPQWPRYVLLGVMLSVGLQLFARLLPIPKNMPMDQFFQTTRQAYVLSLFGITFAPLFEELFFRGFLYPVLNRWLISVFSSPERTRKGRNLILLFAVCLAAVSHPLKRWVSYQSLLVSLAVLLAIAVGLSVYASRVRATARWGLRLGVSLAVLLTALAFALVHGTQLTYAWGPILVIFLVGLTLTLVRSKTKSVAAGLVVHMSYNATISALMFAGTDGFRHLEKLSQ